MDEDFENMTSELVYVGPKRNSPNQPFNPINDVEKVNMFLVKSRNKDDGKTLWMPRTSSYIFQDIETILFMIRLIGGSLLHGNT
jgi:hypothetical protein